MKIPVKIAGYILAAVLLFAACTEDSINTELKTYKLSGKVEKGPFIHESRVAVYELTSSLVPTGRSFVGYTEDDGSFSIGNVEFVSPYVLINADGFYFNEVSGKLSKARLNLTALANLEQSSKVNVNLLTHLERKRVEKLIGEGNSFAQAKSRAMPEVLAVFGMSSDLQAEQTELLDNDATLLTISSILQGFRSEAELSEILAFIA